MKTTKSGISLIALCASGVLAGEPELPQLTYPVEGLVFQNCSNVCRSVVRQLPEHASVLMIQVYTSDKVIVATTAEAESGHTNKVLHVFTNGGSGWKHVRSHPRGRSGFPGLSGEDIQNLIALASRQLDGQDRIVVLQRKSQDEALIMTGGLCGPLAGRGDALLFNLVDGKWVLKRKGRWMS